jgi:hypothetical protein
MTTFSLSYPPQSLIPLQQQNGSYNTQNKYAVLLLVMAPQIITQIWRDNSFAFLKLT